MALSQEQQTKMWAMLNQTRGQIGLTAYKDYIFGILFYKYLSESTLTYLSYYPYLSLFAISWILVFNGNHIISS